MKIVTIVLIVVSTTYCIGQSGDYCGNKKRVSISDIKKKFPYNKTATIRLVSFKFEYLVMQESDTLEVPKDQPVIPKDQFQFIAEEPEMPKTDGVVDLTKMFEVKILDVNETEKALDILVNYDNRHRPRYMAICYEPRNGIVFFDKDDKVLGYIEICFSCRRYVIEPTTIEVSEFCDEKFNALKTLFSSAGIEHGIKSNDEE